MAAGEAEQIADHKLWAAARACLAGHPASPQGAPAGTVSKVPLATLQSLPRLCAWPTGLPLAFDQFRRRFECSYERALFWNSFFDWDSRSGNPSLGSNPRWVEETNAYLRVVQEVLWTTYAVVNDLGAPSQEAPTVALQVGVLLPDSDKSVHNECSGCSKRRTGCVRVTLDTAVFLSKALVLNRSHKQAFLAPKQPRFRGWSAIEGKEFDQRYSMDDQGYPVKSEATSLLPLDAYRVFYEDDRAQMAFSILPNDQGKSAWGLCAVNGNRVPCDRGAVCRERGCDGAPATVLKCSQAPMPQISSRKHDAFHRFVDDAFVPLLRRREEVACALAVASGHTASECYSSSIGLCVATPTADLHDHNGDHDGAIVHGAFAFLNFMVSVQNKAIAQDLGLRLTRAIYAQIGHYQGPLLQEMLDAREAELQMKQRELAKSDQMLRLLQGPLNKVVESFATAHSSIQTLNAILNDPVRAIFAAHADIAVLFDDKTQIKNPDGSSLLISHQPDHYLGYYHSEADKETKKSNILRDLRWVTAHLLARVRGSRCQEGPAYDALETEVYFYSKQADDGSAPFSNFCKQLCVMLGYGTMIEILSSDSAKLVAGLERAKSILFDIFKPDKSRLAITANTLLLLLPGLKPELSTENCLDQITKQDCNPFVTQSHLLEFVAALVAQAGGEADGTGVRWKVTVGSSAEGAYRELELFASPDLARSPVFLLSKLPDMLPKLLLNPNLVSRYASLSCGNFMTPFVELISRSPPDTYIPPSAINQRKLEMSWKTSATSASRLLIAIEKSKLTIKTTVR